MKSKILSYFIVAMLAIIGATSCSKNEIDPEDYLYYNINGTFEKGSTRNLEVNVNGEPLEDFGSVIFNRKTTKCDITFVNVIPGVEKEEFKNVPITTSEDYIYFTVNDEASGKPMVISGNVNESDFLMTIDISM